MTWSTKLNKTVSLLILIIMFLAIIISGTREKGVWWSSFVNHNHNSYFISWMCSKRLRKGSSYNSLLSVLNYLFLWKIYNILRSKLVINCIFKSNSEVTLLHGSETHKTLYLNSLSYFKINRVPRIIIHVPTGAVVFLEPKPNFLVRFPWNCQQHIWMLNSEVSKSLSFINCFSLKQDDTAFNCLFSHLRNYALRNFGLQQSQLRICLCFNEQPQDYFVAYIFSLNLNIAGIFLWICL